MELWMARCRPEEDNVQDDVAWKEDGEENALMAMVVRERRKMTEVLLIEAAVPLLPR